MKRLLNITAICLTMFFFASCQDELNDELFHKFSYLTANGWQEMSVEINEDNTANMFIYFGVNGTSGNDKNIEMTIMADPDTLAGYNFDKYKMQKEFYYTELPSSCYSFDKESYLIPQGDLTSAAIATINMNAIDDIYHKFVLPLKMSSSRGVPMGQDKYTKLLANIIFTNKFSGNYSGSGKITIKGTNNSTSVGSANLSATAINKCYMYAANANQESDPNYKNYVINVTFDEKENITLSAQNDLMNFVPIDAKITRKYKLHTSDSRYYIQTSVLTLKYEYKDLSLTEDRTMVYEGTHTQTKNVLRTEYPDVTLDVE